MRGSHPQEQSLIGGLGLSTAFQVVERRSQQGQGNIINADRKRQ